MSRTSDHRGMRRPDLWLATALVAIQVVLLAIETAVGQLGRAHAPFADSTMVTDLVGDVGILAWAVTGLVIVARQPRNVLGWLFLAANLGWVVSNAATAVAAYSLVVSPLPATNLALWLATWPGQASTAIYVLIVLLFPDGRPISRRWRRLAWFTAGFGIIAGGMAAFAAGQIESLDLLGIPASNPIGFRGPLGRLLGDLASGPIELVVVLLFTAATVSLVLRFRRSSGLERQQLKWLVAAVLATAGLWISIAPFMFAYPSLLTAPAPVRLWNLVAVNGSALIPVAATFAILRYRLWDIDRIVSRTLSYTILTGLLAALFTALVLGLQDLLASVTGAGTLAVAASTLAVAAVFQPLRRLVQRAVDRRFDRARYDGERVVTAFVAQVRDETDLELVRLEVEAAVRQALAPESTAVWMRSR